MLADYCWNLKTDLPTAHYARKPERNMLNLNVYMYNKHFSKNGSYKQTMPDTKDKFIYLKSG